MSRNTSLYNTSVIAKKNPTANAAGCYQRGAEQALPYSNSVCGNLPTVLHVKDLISLLSISHNTAYQLVRSGQIRSIRIGRTYRIPRDAVAEYLAQ